jgi:uncharacterized protein (DUF4415 family)
MNKKPNPELLDADNPAWTAADMKTAVAMSGLPASLQTKMRGRPKAEVTKEPVKIRLDADVLSILRASGEGWQTRINDTLRASLQLAGRLG